jgi:DnaJ-class molecular chaperone
MFDDRNQIKCEPCKGEGYVEVTKFLSDDYSYQTTEACKECLGDGTRKRRMDEHAHSPKRCTFSDIFEWKPIDCSIDDDAMERDPRRN